MNDTTISISGNQMFLVFKTNNEIVSKGFNASIMESKFFQENILSLSILNRAGSGHFFHGAGRVSGLWFWLGSGSGYRKFPRVHFGL